MANDTDLSDELCAAGSAAGEAFWPLPLVEDYRKLLDSPVADLKNIGGRYGGAITAGLFLREFVADDIPWAHLDIAGPAFTDEPTPEGPRGGTGFAVRTLLQFLETRTTETADADAVDDEVEAD
jgi:leucyl aminopeptidase